MANGREWNCESRSLSPCRFIGSAPDRAMLSLWRRHSKGCPHRGEGRAWSKCSCPVWCDGEVGGRRVREALNTRDWARAGRKAAALEGELEAGRTRKPVEEAITAFLEQVS